ncbi:MAG: DcaP family trimeric outer membrane transporter [Rikenellaceae bacterium]
MKKFLLGLLIVTTAFTTMAAEKEESKYSIKASGYVNMRVAYDFNGAINSHPDFVTSLIPVPGDFSNQQEFYMDATTSRFEVKGLAKDTAVGDVELCLNMDFHGGDKGSYTPRLRLAYVAFADFLIGRHYTTFADMGVACPNIDFEGPNVCPYIYTTQIRYTHTFDSNITLGGAVEYHGYSSNSLFGDIEEVDVKAPTIPAYVEYAWDSQLGSHVRLTGLYKNISLYNTADEKNINLAAWGTQFSGSFGIGKRVKLLYSGTCGEGITDFMQDLYGSGLDVTVNTATSDPRMTFMNGFQFIGMVHATDRLMFTAGYSQVNIEGDDSRFAVTDFRQSEYAFGNVFYNLTPRIQIAAEYLWGKRTNVDKASNTANRINTMIQYNF